MGTQALARAATDRRRALMLVAATMAYNAAEAAVALWSGARAESIALVGFGLDSIIEFAAAAIVLWRFSPHPNPESAEHAERRARRFIGGTFLALALYVVGQSGWMLLMREAPAESWIGIALAIVSLIVMPLVAWGKLRVAGRLGSRALAAEAKETLACSYLSFTLLLGLAANALAGWWWADPVAALAMVPWLVREGIEGLRAEEDGCCAAV